MIFKGVATALVTPFTKDDKVDENALIKLLDYQLQNGVNAVVVLGTTGEPATLNEDEKNLVLATAVKRLKGRLPIIVGAGSNSTQNAVKSCQNAQKLGADALLVVTPYYNKCTQEGLVEHYGAIAEATSLPIIVYNVPSRTGVNLLPATFKEICKRNKNVVGIKEASGNMQQIEECIRLTEGKASVYSGDDALAVPVVAMGGKGVISVASNVYPSYFARMMSLALENNVKKASAMQLNALALISSLFCEVNPIPVKYALEAKGLIKGKLRLPLTPLQDCNRNVVDIQMRNLENAFSAQ